MRKLLLQLLFFSVVLSLNANGFYFKPEILDGLKDTHDVVSLPSWGPYSKKYAGISHIPVKSDGLRFDVSVLPGLYRGRVMVPNVLYESAYYPWEVTSDYSKITYRYQLEWKDKLYVDVSYYPLDSASVIVEMNCVNNTSLSQLLQLNLVGFIDYPDPYPGVYAVVPEEACFINATSYHDLGFAISRPSDNLVYDGWLRGEIRDQDFLEGSGIGQNFGADKGDWVQYKIEKTKVPADGSLILRCRSGLNKHNSFKLSGSINSTIEINGTGNFELITIPYKDLNGGLDIKFTSLGGCEVEFDGIFICPENKVDKIIIRTLLKRNKPEFSADLDNGTLILKYPDIDIHYGMAWDFSNSFVREILDKELDVIFKKYVHEHNYLVFPGDSSNHFINVFMSPVELEPTSERTVYSIICRGNKQIVEELTYKFTQNPKTFLAKASKTDKISDDVLKQGEPFSFSRNMIKTVLLSNVVYPIYTQGEFIRHFTPGKWWNSLYTWDAGFITLGLAEIDINKSVEFLNTYTTPVGSQSAFIHHGSPVPVQMYAFFDLWNKTQSLDLLKYFYPRLKQYYEFMVGRLGSSTTSCLNSNLLKTWDYFYNSGGWDDYPPQKWVRDKQLETRVTPVITTAHMIRSAKILRIAAQKLGNKADIKMFDNDINKFTNALQNIAWDKQSGYFSYVVHNDNKDPSNFLTHPDSGENFNMGLDGAYPLFSGICTSQQTNILLNKIFSKDHMWTTAGICVVDKQASYYTSDGYWNGAVWMPHQWFIWKTMFDMGKPDLAWRIAERALQVWKNETDETYYTYEHFFAKTARGAGWHQFGSLSAPVLTWFSAYYKPGTVTTGFEIWIDQQSFNEDFSAYNAVLSFDMATKAHSRTIMVCMNPAFDYQIDIDGRFVEFNCRYDGLIEIELPASNKLVRLGVKKK